MFANQIQQNMKRNFILDQLKEHGITHSQNGTSVNELTYDELKYELVLSSFKEIDITRDAQKWF